MDNDNSLLPDESPRLQLVADYVARVRRIAYGMARTLPRTVNIDDLIGAGLVGLADALARGDATDPNAFECYMSRRVRGAMIDELRRGDPLTRPRRRFERRKERAVKDLTCKLGRVPDEAEIAERLGVPTALLREHLLTTRAHTVNRFDAPGGTADSSGQFPDSTNELADVGMVRTERRNRLVAAVGRLPQRLQTVVSMYYEQDDSLRVIGDALGVSESRVCQLHRQAIDMLRAACPPSEAPPSNDSNAFASVSSWV